jgi:hypothetical protein
MLSMANKPAGKNWSEIQLAITAVAITAMLGFWNFFSTPEKAQASAQVAQTSTPPPPPPPTEMAQPTATVLALRPVKIIFGGNAPQQPVIQVAVAQPPTKKKRGGGNNGGGGGNPAPAPVTGTGSS